MAIDIVIPKQAIRDGNLVIRDARIAAGIQAGQIGHTITGHWSITNETADSITVSFVSQPLSTTPGGGTVGPAGPTGPAGPKGDKGDKGDQGNAGASGAVGDIGPAGLTGAQGPPGERGPQGEVGPSGSPGGTGPAGPKGDKGDVGPTGSTGPAGPKGDTGDAGPAGTPGAPGAKGDKGDKGDIGLTGQTGPAGPPGGNTDIIRALVADASGVNANTAQPIFIGLAAITLAAATAYDFDMVAHITRAAGTTSHTTGISFGGTATLQATGGIEFLVQASSATGNVLSNDSMLRGESNANLVVTAASAVATENIRIRATGMVRTNAAGTFIPQFTYSAAPGGVPTIRRNSFIRLTPRGAASVTAVN